MNNKLIIIALLVGLLIFMNTKQGFTPEDAENALKRAVTKYGKEKSQLMEKMLRLETGNFKSKIYQNTGGAGMTLGSWGDRLKGIKIAGKYKTAGNPFTFYKFYSVDDFLQVLSGYLDDHRAGNWYSTEEAKQIEYENKLQNIKPKITA